MANTNTSNKKKEDIEFYLYDNDNKLVSREKRIYSKYNLKSQWYPGERPTFIDPDFVMFNKWIYILSGDIDDDLYAQRLDFLSLYNHEGGRLSAWKWIYEKCNWTFVKWDWNHIVRQELIEDKNSKIVTVTEEKVIEQIPRVFADTLQLSQLRALCDTYWIEEPKNIEWWPKVIKSTLIELLDSNNRLSN